MLKIDELNKIKSIFPQNELKNLTIDKLKEIMQLQNIIELNGLNYKAKTGRKNNFNKYLLSIVF